MSASGPKIRSVSEKMITLYVNTPLGQAGLLIRAMGLVTYYVIQLLES